MSRFNFPSERPVTRRMIAAHYGIDSSTLRRKLKRAGFNPPPGLISRELQIRIKRILEGLPGFAWFCLVLENKILPNCSIN